MILYNTHMAVTCTKSAHAASEKVDGLYEFYHLHATLSPSLSPFVSLSPPSLSLSLSSSLSPPPCCSRYRVNVLFVFVHSELLLRGQNYSIVLLRYLFRTSHWKYRLECIRSWDHHRSTVSKTSNCRIFCIGTMKILFSIGPSRLELLFTTNCI